MEQIDDDAEEEDEVARIYTYKKVWVNGESEWVNEWASKLLDMAKNNDSICVAMLRHYSISTTVENKMNAH